MVGHGGSSAGSYFADPTSLIPSHCASIVVTSTLRVNWHMHHSELVVSSIAILLQDSLAALTQWSRTIKGSNYTLTSLFKHIINMAFIILSPSAVETSHNGIMRQVESLPQPTAVMSVAACQSICVCSLHPIALFLILAHIKRVS